MYMKKYNVTYTVYFDNSIKNIDTAIMAANDNEAVKISTKNLEKHLEKTNRKASFELDDVTEYKDILHSAKLNGFYEYKPA